MPKVSLQNEAALTQARLKELLHYDPETGIFTNLVYRGNKAYAGTRAGTDKGNGYRGITIDQRRYKEQRLAFLYMTGEWPPHDVDHRNLDGSANGWGNLRPATRSQNQANKPKMSKPRTSRFKGVHWLKLERKWCAKMKVHGRNIYIGRFRDEELAARAYDAAAIAAFGEFARPNFPEGDKTEGANNDKGR
jgi:hypothetical protein